MESALHKYVVLGFWPFFSHTAEEVGLLGLSIIHFKDFMELLAKVLPMIPKMF